MNTASIKRYIKSRFIDWLLCAFMAAGISVNVLSGFEMTDPVSYNVPLMILISALLQAVCLAGLYNRKTVIGMTAAFFVLIIAVIAYGRSSGAYSDEADYSVQILITVSILVNVLIALLSISRGGNIFLILAGTLAAAAAAFLEFPVVTGAFYVFLVSSVLLLLYRVYSVTVRNTVRGEAQYARFALQLFCLCLAGMLLALCIFFMIIKPLNPETHELKLIQKLEQSDIIKRTGIATVYTFPSMDLRSKLQADNSMTADTPEEQLDNEDQSDKSDMPDDNVKEGVLKDQLQDAYAVRYVLDHNLWWLLIIVVILVLAAPFVIKEALRRRRYRIISAMSRESQVVNLYAYYMKTFKRLGFKRMPDTTLKEYAAHHRRDLEPYDAADVNFTELTDIYTSLYYGLHEISPEEADRFHAYFDGLRGRIKAERGSLFLLRKYFLL